jgi:hypothetical protein
LFFHKYRNRRMPVAMNMTNQTGLEISANSMERS